MESKKVDAPPQPRYPRRRRMLQAALAFTGLGALENFLPLSTAFAEPNVSTRPPEEHPPKETIQDQRISREELDSKYHIKILDLPDLPNFIRLNFRQAAAEKPLFQQQAAGDTELYVVLINGPYLDPGFLTEEQRKALPQEGIDKLSEACNATIRQKMNEYTRREKILKTRYTQNLEQLQQQLDAGKIDENKYTSEKQLLEKQYLEPTRQEMLQNDGGLTITPELNRTKGKYVFYAARDQELTADNDSVAQNPPADYIYEARALKPSLPGEPKPEQSHPTPKQFVVNRNSQDYPIEDGHTASTVLRHELLHAQGVNHPNTDFLLLEDIAVADKKFKDEGDDSEYFIEWETPSGRTVSQTSTVPAAA